MTRLKLYVLALALVLVAPLPTLAQSYITGDWLVTIDTPQGAQTIDATMKQAGEELTGTIVTPMGSVDFKGKMINDALDVAYTLDLQGNAIEIKMTGKLAGDSLAGNLNFGGLGDIPWTAKRKAAGATAAATATASAAAPAAAATCGSVSGDRREGRDGQVGYHVQHGRQPDARVGQLHPGRRQGQRHAGHPGRRDADHRHHCRESLKLAFSVETPQGNLEIVMTGDVTGDDIVGKATLTGLGDADWTGKRVQ